MPTNGLNFRLIVIPQEAQPRAGRRSMSIPAGLQAIKVPGFIFETQISSDLFPSPKKDSRKRFDSGPWEHVFSLKSTKGTARQQEKDKLIEIAAMAKIDPGPNSFNKAFYPVSWTYSTYKPDGRPSITSARVRECHQCHGIAFHLTGDLIFTQFP